MTLSGKSWPLVGVPAGRFFLHAWILAIWIGCGPGLGGLESRGSDAHGASATPATPSPATAHQVKGHGTAEAEPEAEPAGGAEVGSKNPGAVDLILRGFSDQSRTIEDAELSGYRNMLDQARRERGEGKAADAASRLIAIMRSAAPDEVKRPALFELGLVAQDDGQLSRAVQIFAQYIDRYPQQPGVIDAFMRQGLLYRQMGATTLAIAKFYSVMTTALSLRLEQFEYYQRLVLQAKIEIADTYYLEGRWSDATDFFRRLLKEDANRVDRSIIHAKLIRALAAQDRPELTAAQAQNFLEQYPQSGDVPEVRFTLASKLKQMGRSQEALQQVLKLLESQQGTAAANPEAWAYWQKRAGNEIANQLYKEGDYLGTLDIYQRLVELDKSAEWQLPVMYQIGLVLERLQQPAKASQVYQNLIRREAEAGGTNAPPSMKTVIEMARWRQGNLGWLMNASSNTAAIRQSAPPPNVATLPVP
ncbi:MAG: tetratricopeptide repeat protein [Verrucomicrobiales bacterium]|nr:tetratricopeptide repeat protein [Verrucomicrobiales bacterium]